jgi:hypothetical protein
MEFTLKFLGVLFAMFCADICWAYYFIKIEERKSLAAGLWASAIYIFGAFTVTSYIVDKRLIAAAILGSFLGTWATVEYKRRKERKNEHS